MGFNKHILSFRVQGNKARICIVTMAPRLGWFSVRAFPTSHPLLYLKIGLLSTQELEKRACWAWKVSVNRNEQSGDTGLRPPCTAHLVNIICDYWFLMGSPINTQVPFTWSPKLRFISCRNWKTLSIESNVNHSSWLKQKKEFAGRIVGLLMES